MDLTLVSITKPDSVNVIIGQSHFIKTVEDLHEAIVQTAPQMKFGIAFCESSGPALLRRSGNDAALIDLATTNGMALSCGHVFVIFIDNGFPVNILNAVNRCRKSAGSSARRPIPCRSWWRNRTRGGAFSASSTESGRRESSLRRTSPSAKSFSA